MKTSEPRLIHQFAPKTAGYFACKRLAGTHWLRVRSTADPRWFLVKPEQRVYNKVLDGETQFATSCRKILPEIKDNAGFYPFQVAATDVNVLGLESAYGKNIEFEDTEASVKWATLVAQLQVLSLSTARKAEFKLNGTMPPKPETWIDSRPPLMNHQAAATWLSIGKRFFPLLFDRGTGKTAVVINRVCHEARLREDKSIPYRALIVVPNAVLDNWIEEFDRFATCKGRAAILRGTKVKRIELLTRLIMAKEGSEYSVLIASYETVVRDLQLLFLIEWDMCVLDEAQAIKSTATKRFKAFIKLRDRCRQRKILTGTPITNSPLDLFALFEFLEQGFSGFVTFKGFKKFYGRFDNPMGPEQITGYQNLPMMQERMNLAGFVVRKEDVLTDLPPEQHDMVKVEMSPRQKEYYTSAQQEIKIEIEADLAAAGGRNKQLVIQHIFTKLLRLAQITSGIVKWDDQFNEDGDLVEKGEVDIIETPKLDMAISDISELPVNEKAVVWCPFVPMILHAHKKLQEADFSGEVYYGQISQAKRKAAVRRFNEDINCKYIVVNQAAGGAGLNLLGYDWWNGEDGAKLDTNCTFNAWIALTWSMAQRTQGLGRTHRKGTRLPVLHRDYLTEAPIDKRIRDKVTGMIELANDMSDMEPLLKDILTVLGD